MNPRLSWPYQFSRSRRYERLQSFLLSRALPVLWDYLVRAIWVVLEEVIGVKVQLEGSRPALFNALLLGFLYWEGGGGGGGGGGGEGGREEGEGEREEGRGATSTGSGSLIISHIPLSCFWLCRIHLWHVWVNCLW